MIRQALDDANGDATAAAKQLGMDPKELQRKVKKMGLADGDAAGEDE
jgi:DNA-binding NtrC family response regulator